MNRPAPTRNLTTPAQPHPGPRSAAAGADPVRFANTTATSGRDQPRGWTPLPHEEAKSTHFISMCAPRFRRHEPSREIGCEPKRSEGNPRRSNPHDRGQTDKRFAFANRAAVPSEGDAVNITENVHKYAISEEAALAKGKDEKSTKFVAAGAEVYAKG